MAIDCKTWHRKGLGRKASKLVPRLVFDVLHGALLAKTRRVEQLERRLSAKKGYSLAPEVCSRLARVKGPF